MWDLLDSDDPGYLADLKRIAKHHAPEIEVLFSRLDQLLICLNSGMPLPIALQRGWVHQKYKHGMKSIDSGGGKGKPSLRLYILPSQQFNVVAILGVGLKADESKAIKRAYSMLDEVLRELE